MSKYSNVERGHQYAVEVVRGDILACKWIRLACDYYLKELRRSKDNADFPYIFDKAAAEKEAADKAAADKAAADKAAADKKAADKAAAEKEAADKAAAKKADKEAAEKAKVCLRLCVPSERPSERPLVCIMH